MTKLQANSSSHRSSEWHQQPVLIEEKYWHLGQLAPPIWVSVSPGQLPLLTSRAAGTAQLGPFWDLVNVAKLWLATGCGQGGGVEP